MEHRSDGSEASRPKNRGLSIDTAWIAIALVTPVAATFLGRTMAIDLAYQIRAGAEMLAAGHVLDVDTFTFTVGGEPWLNQQWGAQVVLAWLFDLGGWGGLALTRGVLLGATLVFLFLACRAAGAATRTAALLTLIGWFVGIEILTQLRPQQFAFLLFSVSLWVCTTRRAHPWRLWLVPVLVVPWANIHGSFPLVLLILGLAWLEDRRASPSTARIALLAAAGCVAASLVNPYGPRVWSYVLELSTHPVVSRQVAEWGPPSLHSWTGRLFFASLLVVAALSGRITRQVDWIKLLTLALFAIIGLVAIRGVVWWSLIAPVVVAGVLNDGAGARRDARSPMNVAVVAGLGLLLAVSLPFGRGTDPRTGGPATLTFAPERLVAAARGAVPPGSNAFVSQLHASWSELSAPGLAVAVDPRIEIFPADVWDEYFAVTTGRDGWEGILERWDVRVMILHPEQAEGLLAVVGGSCGWERTLATEDGAVYVRVEAPIIPTCP